MMGITMNKPPAYQYYASDFEQGTADFTIEEVGIYQRLLNFEWTNGSIPDDPKKLSLICRCNFNKFMRYWPKVRSKFKQQGESDLVNEKMENVRVIQMQFREKQSQRAKLRYATD
jgi:uncharacterized protein YdaU (DUF1376 family)